MVIQGAKVFTAGHIFDEYNLIVAGDRIRAVTKGMLPGFDDVVIDGTGLTAIPGLIDLHFHGAEGIDIADCSTEEFHKLARFEASKGILTICPALTAVPEEQSLKALATASAYMGETHGEDEAEMVGLHLEGPFLNRYRAGAQNSETLKYPDIALANRLLEAGRGLVKIMDCAPELPGGMELIEALADKVKVSLSHTEAGYDTAVEALKKGASHVTHLFNAMPYMHHRVPGPIPAAHEYGAEVELIADGEHVHPGVVRFVFNVFADDKVVLVSDSIEACGMPDGRYTLGGQAVEKAGNRAVVVGRPDTLAGSVSNLYDCMRKAIVDMGVAPEKAVRAASENPALALGLAKDYGSLRPGKIANILLVDENWELKYVVMKGKIIG